MKNSPTIQSIKNLKTLRNVCFNEDIIKTLEKCVKEGLKFNMIYSDPDYNVDISYSGINYKKKWNEYMDWYGRLTKLSLQCLEDDGHLFLLNYPKQNSHLRVKYLDELNEYIREDSSSYDLVRNGKVSEYVWIYNSNIGISNRSFTTAHRSILHLTKSKNAKLIKGNWWMPFKNPGPVSNRLYKKLINEGCSDEDAKEISNNHVVNSGRMPYSWINEFELEESILKNEGKGSMYHDLVKNYSPSKTIHPCQIPAKLVSGLIQSSTNENDHVFIHFGGSGNELIECKSINRYFTSCEISKEYHEMIINRLKSENKKVQNKYKLIKSNIGIKT